MDHATKPAQEGFVLSKRWRHQEEAFQFLVGKDAGGLFLGMGAGKSRVAIDLLDAWGVHLALIVCPARVIGVWPSQFDTHAPEWGRVILLDTGSTEKNTALIKRTLNNSTQARTAFVINYENVWRPGIRKVIEALPWGAVVCDESHRIKSQGSKASVFLGNLGKKVSKRLALTGTPLPHSPLDAYGQYRFLDPRIFGTNYSMFRATYAELAPLPGKPRVPIVKGYRNLEQLHEKMYSIAFRVRTDEVLDLPPTMDEVVPVTLSPKARKLYDELEEEFIVALEGDIENGKVVTAPNTLVKLLRLQQLTGGWLTPDEHTTPVQVDTGKAGSLTDLLQDMGDEPVVVFCRFTADLRAVREVCDKLGISYGEISGKQDDLVAFQQGKCQVIGCQIRSGSMGIDLTRSRYTIYYSNTHSLGDYEQSRARVHRPGQTRPVTYYHLLARDTVDYDIFKSLRDKGQLVDLVVDIMRKRGRNV